MIWLRSYLLLGLIAHKAAWEFLGRANKSARERFRPVKLLKIALLFGFVLQSVIPPLFPITPEPGFQVVLGTLLFSVGLGLAITARFQLGRNWANIESATVLRDQRLVADGVYRYCRHPIYLGDLLLVAGFELALNSWLVLLVAPLAIYVWRKAGQEEQLLTSKLTGYADYLRRSGRFLPSTALVGVTVAALAFLIQFTLVQVHYHGNWTGMYVHGGLVRVPPQLDSESIWTFSDSTGYDGQFYHFMAHDPFLTGGVARYIDAPRLRYPRILLPVVAYALAGGRQDWIDPALFSVCIAAFGFGAWWLARFAEWRGRNPFWGLAFLALPVPLISLERVTVDLLLIALSCGFLFYAARRQLVHVFVVLVFAALTRETGLLLWGAYGLWLLFNRNWARAFLFGVAAIPWTLWTMYVFSIVPPDRAREFYLANSHDAIFLYSVFLHRLSVTVKYPFPEIIANTATALDHLSLVGTLLATILAFRWFYKQPLDPVRITAAVFGAFPFLIGGVVGWYEPFGYPRSLAPLFLVLMLAAIESRRWLYATPLLMVLPRIGMQLAPKIPGVSRLIGTP